MPSVPKYFRAIFPKPGEGRAFQSDDRPIAGNLQKKRAVSAAMDKGRHGRGARRPLAGGSLFSRLIAAGGGRLRDIDRIGRGKAVLEALFERSLEPAFADFFPIALGLVVEFLL